MVLKGTQGGAHRTLQSTRTTHMTLGYLPVSSSPDSRSSSRSQWLMLRFARNGPVSFALLAIALVTGLLGGYILTSPAHKTALCTSPFDTPGIPFEHETTSFPNTAQPHQSHEGSLLVSDDLDLEALRSIVTSTRGYYARDYSMGLGWNNVRYSACQYVLALTNL